MVFDQVMVFTNSIFVSDMKVNGKTIISMEMENCFAAESCYSKGNSKMV